MEGGIRPAGISCSHDDGGVFNDEASAAFYSAQSNIQGDNSGRGGGLSSRSGEAVLPGSTEASSLPGSRGDCYGKIGSSSSSGGSGCLLGGDGSDSWSDSRHHSFRSFLAVRPTMAYVPMRRTNAPPGRGNVGDPANAAIQPLGTGDHDGGCATGNDDDGGGYPLPPGRMVDFRSDVALSDHFVEFELHPGGDGGGGQSSSSHDSNSSSSLGQLSTSDSSAMAAGCSFAHLLAPDPMEAFKQAVRVGRWDLSGLNIDNFIL